MKTIWTKHLLDPEDKQRFENSIKSSKWVLDHLSTILQGIDNGQDRSETSPQTYDNPNWAYKQAHANGFRHCLKTIQSLINLDHKENNV